MKILHLLSQRPEATGSGIYIQAMIREAARRGHENFLLAVVPRGEEVQPAGLASTACEFVTFHGGDLPFPVVGMSAYGRSERSASGMMERLTTKRNG